MSPENKKVSQKVAKKSNPRIEVKKSPYVSVRIEAEDMRYIRTYSMENQVSQLDIISLAIDELRKEGLV